jgi:hypothetical protein
MSVIKKKFLHSLFFSFLNFPSYYPWALVTSSDTLVIKSIKKFHNFMLAKIFIKKNEMHHTRSETLALIVSISFRLFSL